MLHPPRRLIVSFLLVLLLPALVVVWLGVRLIQQDRVLEARQLREWRESGSDRIVARLKQAISSSERTLAGDSRLALTGTDDDAIVVTLNHEMLVAAPANRLLYYPVAVSCPEPAGAFGAAEEIEFRAQDYAKAAASLRESANTTDAQMRAGALLRLARNLRKAGKTDEALRAYVVLETVQGGCVAGVPADLAARRARAALLAESGRKEELRNVARTLASGLLAARWHIDRGAYEAYSSQVAQWLEQESKIPAGQEAMAKAVEWLWTNRPLTASGSRNLAFEGTHVTVIWKSASGRVSALVAGPRFQQREWFTAIAGERDLEVTLLDEEQQPVSGPRPAAGKPTLVRTAAETGLPWAVVVATAGYFTGSEAFAGRQRILFAGLALVGILVIAGSYFILRAVAREFALAKIQSDFVSAVSHEFRTPLTTLREFNELLLDNENLPREKRRMFYQAQTRATDRLHRLVESLLDFGRMEAGKQPYRLQPMKAAALVHDVVDEFEREPGSRDFTIERRIDPSVGNVHADGDAIGHALWNLLDNAAKYSGGSHTIQVFVELRDGSVAISVRDRGLGIPPHEQNEIFHKFVRGSASREHGIRGTGIGLALVKHIVNAHGGSVGVESAHGEGSTFTMLLPARDS